MRGDRNIWRINGTGPQILCLHRTMKPKTNGKAPGIEKYSVVKVQFACEPSGDSLCASGSQTQVSGDERAFQVEAGLRSDMHHSVAPIVAQIVIANAILLGIHQIGQDIL